MSTTQDLLKMVQEMAGISDEEASQVNYKYVIYVRKSTESEERQTRSLGDQIKECKDLAQRFGLNVVKIFKESESAKEPDIRPVFREMINRIKAGKYDGIISWHPDRLSRNMKEAGEVIDLIDKSIIKDLQFVSFTFQNNASGKMLLGIAFVLSKQYSDQLSANVKRGIKRSIEDGKAFNRPKHGYFKDRNFYLRPDGANFLLMKHAWKLRAEHKQLTEIAEYLNNNAYQRAYFEGKHEEFKMNKKKLSEIFSDTTYAGVMKYGEKNTVDLTQVYDFIPMVTVDEFLKINKTDTINKFFKLRDRNKTDVQANLMRGRILCGQCGIPMTSTMPYKKIKQADGSYIKDYRYYYRCDNSECDFYGKSVRAKIILDFAVDFFKKYQFSTPEVYEHYKQEMRNVILKNEEEINSVEKSLLAKKRNTEKQIENIKSLMYSEKDDKDFVEDCKSDIKKANEDLAKCIEAIDKLKKEKEINRQAIIPYEKFLELFQKLPSILQNSKEMEELNYYLKKVYLNLTVEKTKVVSYQLESPFKELIEKGFVTSNRDDRT